MAVNKKRDFKRLSVCIRDFLKRLPCDQTTGFLRDTLCLSLLELHKYYIKEKERFGEQKTLDSSSTYRAVFQDSLGDAQKYDGTWKECDDGEQFMAVNRNIHNLQDGFDDCDSLGRTHLMYAIHGDHQDTIDHILSLNTNINHQAQDGSSVLHIACQHEKPSVVSLLLKNKANVLVTDKKGRSPLHWAAKCKLSDTVKFLLQYGGDVSSKDCDGMTPAMWACYFHKPDNLHIIRNAILRVDPRPEAILDEQDNFGRTVLHWMVMTCDPNGSLGGFKELLVMGDVCNIKDNKGRTILHTAAIQGSISICKEIIQVCGKEILNVKDNENQTALHLATLCGHGDMVDFLLQQEANSEIVNKNERTALQEAEIGHYHYCLLVFVAFEQIKDKTKLSTDKINNDMEKKNKKYESWVIPSTSLNESQDIPTNLTGEQLVDVTEVKGFEINQEDPDEQFVPEKLVTTNIFTTQNTEKVDSSTTIKPSVPGNDSMNLDISQDNLQPGPMKRFPLTGRSNKNTVLQRSERIEEIKEEDLIIPRKNDEPMQENGESSSEQNDDDDEISSLNIESENDESTAEDDYKHEGSNNNNIKTSIEKNSGSAKNKVNKDGLSPIQPQQNFSFPLKLEPIPLPRTNKTLARGIVQPLQPAVLKKQPAVSLLSRDKLQHYGTPRGRDHGPLAQTHSKELLENVFRGNKENKKEEKNDERVQDGKFSRPRVKHAMFHPK
ncbi:protein phosphatase 1 regulatory subunit 12A-like [Dendronephthya gigantea]|uniref:protein phosphatase 1 regulatory subunit 12A-like n=1 Tax=Dendronephthya gigantea TaxID=151771 RepID=UPI001069E788|nr:protein phosphatase 1 regulatory subunit 12A-like [Dendronephthya gigantea]